VNIPTKYGEAAVHGELPELAARATGQVWSTVVPRVTVTVALVAPVSLNGTAHTRYCPLAGAAAQKTFSGPVPEVSSRSS
jgi:hypothetical protein